MIWLIFIAQVGTLNVGTFSYGYPQARISMPTNQPIYAVVGSTNRIYFRNVVRFDGDWALLTNSVICTKGVSTATSWTYTPTIDDVGTNALTITVKSKTAPQTLASVTCSLVTRPASYPQSPVSRKLLLVGDSTSASGKVSAQLVKLFSGDATYALAEFGSNDGSATDSDGVSRTVAMDAVSGWTFNMFNTSTNAAWTEIGGTPRTGSPFVFGGFDFVSYLSTNGFTMSAGDWVIFNLGINGIFGATSDSALATVISTETHALTNMLSVIQAAVPGVRVGVALTIPPNESEAAFIGDYGTSPYTLARYRRNNHLWVESLLARFDAVTVSGVRLISLNANIDCSANMQNGVHPAAAGYYQIADSYYAFLKGNE